MQKIALGIAAFVVGAAPVFAQPASLRELRVETAGERFAEREAAKDRWEELKAARQAKREEVKAYIQVRREEVKANVQAMRDARKKAVVERVQERLNNVNARRSEHFTNVLERLSTILDKIESRTEKAKTEGKDVAAIESAIASARSAISTAQSAVDAQEVKTYEITVTDDAAARGEVDAMIKQLHADLRAVHDTVVAARQAVYAVFEQIKTVVGSTEGATPSATGSSVTP